MSTYTDWQQRELDIASGRELDRLARIHAEAPPMTKTRTHHLRVVYPATTHECEYGHPLHLHRTALNQCRECNRIYHRLDMRNRRVAARREFAAHD